MRETILTVLVFSWFGCMTLDAATVWVDGTSAAPAAPYATEETAAATFADAVVQADALARAGDVAVVVRVKDGTYDLNGEVGVGFGIRYESVNGPEATVVNQTVANCRAFCVTNGTVSGFTIHGIGCDDIEPVASSVDSEDGFAVLIRNVSGAAACVSNCVIEGFVSTRTANVNPALYGGTVNIRGSGSRLESSIIRNNVTSGPGGGVFLRKDAYVVGCVITNNEAKASGGGVECYEGGRLSNSLIAYNRSSSHYNGTKGGAGVYGNYWTGSALIENCTIAFNATTVEGAAGGLVKTGAVGCTIVNTVIYGNTSAGAVGNQVSLLRENTASFLNCILGETPAGAKEDVDNLIGAVPAFVSPSAGDLRLTDGSPGIDGGRDMMLPMAYDLGGRPRVVDGSGDGTAVPDIGCYEYDRKADGTWLSVDPLTDRYVFAGSSVSFGASFSFAGQDLPEAEYMWDFGDGTVVQTGRPEVSHVYRTEGAFTLTVTATAGGRTGTLKIDRAACVFSADRTVVWVTPNGERESDADSPADALAQAKELIAGGATAVTVAVAPGTYVVGEALAIDKAIALVGPEGPEKTVFTAPADTAVSFVKLSHDDAVLSGIALADSKNPSQTSVVALNIEKGLATNCVIRGIESFWSWQKPSHGCALTMSGGRAVEVTVRDNRSKNTRWYLNGSPVRLSGTAVMDRCRILGNSSGLPYEAWIVNRRNRADELAGGGVYLASGTPVCRNTLIAGNETVSQPGAGAYLVAGTLENCTVAGNSMTSSTNGTWSAGIYVWPGAQVVNCISDVNMNGEKAVNAGGEEGTDFTAAYIYSCLSGFTSGGRGCTSEDPLLDADYRPDNVKKVLGRGRNLDWMTDALDLAGFPRIQGARVDMGCYESDRCFVYGMKLIVR